MGIQGRFFFCCCASAYASVQAHYAQNIGCCNGICSASNDEECACFIAIIITFLAVTVLGFVLLYVFFNLAFPSEEDLEYERLEKEGKLDDAQLTPMHRGLLEDAPQQDPVTPVVPPTV